MTRDEIIASAVEVEIETEMHRGLEKYGRYASLHEAYAVIREELDELWDEIKRRDPRRDVIEREATQVAATAMRLVIESRQKASSAPEPRRQE